MPSPLATNLDSLTQQDLSMLRRNWYWFVILGIAILLFGVAGLVMVGLLSIITTVMVGWFLVIGGLAEVLHAIFRRGWNGFFIDFLSGALSLVLGLMIVAEPLRATVALTWVIGALLLLGGIFRLVFAFFAATPYGPWILFHGIIGILLGGMILGEWPISGQWVIGTLVAVDMIVNGMRLATIGFAAKHLPAPPASVSH